MPSLTQTQEDRVRKSHIDNPKFSTENIGESGPINDVLSCGHTTQKFRDHYDEIQWDKD